MGAFDADARRLSKVIEHPIRARIIDLLGERGPLGWKELSTELGVKTGALYHHLDMLEGLVGRDAAKKYFLTKSGRIVYSKTSQAHTIEAVKQAAVEIRQEGAARRVALSLFVPRPLFSILTSTKLSSSVVLLVVGASLAAYSGLAGFAPSLFYLRQDPGFFQTVGGFGVSLLALVVLSYISVRFVFKSEADPVSLTATTSVSFLPVYAFSVLSLVPAVSSFLTNSSLAFTLLLVSFQTWSSVLLGAGMSVSSGVRVERTLLASLGILYVTMVLMLLQGRTV